MRNQDLKSAIKRLYLSNPQGLSDKDVAKFLGISRPLAVYYRDQLNAQCINEIAGKHGGYRQKFYTLTPSSMDIAEAKRIIALSALQDRDLRPTQAEIEYAQSILSHESE